MKQLRVRIPEVFVIDEVQRLVEERSSPVV